jgi:hypothetical protein
MTVECDKLVYERKELDPYVEKFGDYKPTQCTCEDCRRFRSKYDLEGKRIEETEVYEPRPTMGQEA